jgi:hypothetical protein
MVTSYGADLEHLVPVGVERVLLVVLDHPLRHDRAAARHDARDAVFHERQVLDEHARVDGEVVDALLGLVLEHVDEVVGRERLDVLSSLERLVDGHRADGHGDACDDRRRMPSMSPPVDRSMTVSAPYFMQTASLRAPLRRRS